MKDDQLSLLDYTPPYQRHSGTSLNAAEQIREHLGALQKVVYDYHKERGAEGSTDNEGIEALEMSPSTYRPRRIELVQRGELIDSGKRRVGPSGRLATVWCLKELVGRRG